MRILLIHTSYQLKGGEDAVFKLEKDLLSKKHVVETLHFQNKTKISGAIQFLTSIWNLRKNGIVKKKIKSFSPDIIHLHNWHFAIGPLVIRGIKKQGIPLVVTLHNFRLICPSATLFHNKKRYLHSLKQNFPWKAVQDKVYRNSYFQTFWLALVVWFHKKKGTWQMVDRYICPSSFMVDLFCDSTLDLNREHFFVKPNFSESTKIKSTLKPKEHFLFVGRLAEEKGIKCLLEAFKNSKEKIKIVGDGPLKEMVEQYSLAHNNISYLGFLSKERISDELQQANALIFPSIWYEPFGLTITEAFSNKCAVIASNIGAPKTLIEDTINGFHFKYGNSEDLHRVIEKWKNLPESQRKKIKEGAYQSYQTKFSIKSQELLLNDIYNKTLKN